MTNLPLKIVARLSLSACFILLLSCWRVVAEIGCKSYDLPTDKKEVRCVIHFHSQYSHSDLENDSLTTPLTMEEILLKARAEDIDVIIPTEHASGTIVWRPFPLLGILSVKKMFPSILAAASPEKYLLEIARLKQKYRDITIIPGAECSVGYSWSGPSMPVPTSGKTISLIGWHRHILAIGLENPQDYYDMPVASAHSSGNIDILMFWPLIFVIIGWRLMRRHPMKGFLMLAGGIVFLWGNYPFTQNTSGRIVSTDKDIVSHEDVGSFQKLIDFVAQRGGLTFWAHPETKNERTYQIHNFKISSRTEPYPELLLRTSAYDGFAIFAEGYRSVGKPEGLWDRILVDYCRGKRDTPVWAISEANLDSGNFCLDSSFGALQNVLWLEDSKIPFKQRVLAALKKGRFYALWKHGKDGLIIKDFSVQVLPSVFELKKATGTPIARDKNEKAVFGETIHIPSPDDEIKICLETTFSNGSKIPAKIFMISNGKTAGIFETILPAKITHRFKPAIEAIDVDTQNSADRKRARARKGYIRFFIDAGYPNYIATNPVFYTVGKN